MSFGSVSRRERLVGTAIRLGISFPTSITDDELRLLIDAQPASTRQRRVLEEYMRVKGWGLPADTTYGLARHILVQGREALNQYTIRQMGLVQGTILHWRDEYYRVVRACGPNSEFRIELRKVALARQRGKAVVSVQAVGPEFKINPVNLLSVSVTVDLRTWRPGFKSSPLTDPDEPMF